MLDDHSNSSSDQFEICGGKLMQHAFETSVDNVNGTSGEDGKKMISKINKDTVRLIGLRFTQLSYKHQILLINFT